MDSLDKKAFVNKLSFRKKKGKKSIAIPVVYGLFLITVFNPDAWDLTEPYRRFLKSLFGWALCLGIIRANIDLNADGWNKWDGVHRVTRSPLTHTHMYNAQGNRDG